MTERNIAPGIFGRWVGSCPLSRCTVLAVGLEPEDRVGVGKATTLHHEPVEGTRYDLLVIGGPVSPPRLARLLRRLKPHQSHARVKARVEAPALWRVEPHFGGRWSLVRRK